MNKFQVYLTNDEVINIEADNFMTNYENNTVRRSLSDDGNLRDG